MKAVGIGVGVFHHSEQVFHAKHGRFKIRALMSSNRYKLICTKCWLDHGIIRNVPSSRPVSSSRMAAALRARRLGLCSQHRSEHEDEELSAPTASSDAVCEDQVPSSTSNDTTQLGDEGGAPWQVKE
jgi:hypothetical protein